MQKVLFLILFCCSTLFELSASRVTSPTQLYPTSFVYDRGMDGWVTESYAVVSKAVLEQVGSMAKRALFTTNRNSLKEALARPIPQIATSYQCEDANLKQMDILLELLDSIVYDYVRKCFPSGFNIDSWNKFIDKDQGLLINLIYIMFNLKVIESTGKDINPLLGKIYSLGVVSAKKDWKSDTVAYKGASDTDHLLDGLNTYLSLLNGSACDLISKHLINDTDWTNITKHIVNQVVSIPCLTPGNIKATSWSPDGYARGLISMLSSPVGSQNNKISKLQYVIQGMSASSPHMVMRYYRQALEMSLGMIREAYPDLDNDIPDSSPSMTIGRYMYVMMGRYPEQYLTSCLTHDQVVNMLQDINRLGSWKQEANVRIEARRYWNQKDNAQEVVVPFVVLQKLLCDREVQERLKPENLNAYARFMFRSSPENIDTILELSIGFLRGVSEVLIDSGKSGSFAEILLAQYVSDYSERYRDASSLDNRTAGMIHYAALLFLLQNPEMKDVIFREDSWQRQKYVDILFGNVLSMTKAFFLPSSEEGQLVRRISDENAVSYKENMMQTIWRLKPIVNEISLCRTKIHLDMMTKVYQHLETWPHFSEGYRYAKLPDPRIITFVDAASGKPRYKVAMTMAMNNLADGECWAYSLRTSGEPRVKQLITNLHGEEEYKALHVGDNGKYTPNPSVHQFLVNYSPYTLGGIGIRVLYEEIVEKGARIGEYQYNDDVFATEDKTTLTDQDGRTDVMFDTRVTPRIATSRNVFKHYWMNVDICDPLDIAQSMRIFR